MLTRNGLLLLALSLGGCAGMGYAMEHYTGIDPVPVAVEGDDIYRVFDKTDAGRMMVTSSLGNAFAQGAGRGMFLGAVDTTPPKPLFERAALQYLQGTERGHCRITDGYLIVTPQYEFKYDCSPVQATLPGPVSPVRRR